MFVYTFVSCAFIGVHVLYSLLARCIVYTCTCRYISWHKRVMSDACRCLTALLLIMDWLRAYMYKMLHI